MLCFEQELDIYGEVINFGGPKNTHPEKQTTRPDIIRYRGIFCAHVCVCL